MSQAENRLDSIFDVNINSEIVAIFYFYHNCVTRIEEKLITL